eukprot:10011709-Ditylum_brightwellii.AAC.1
MPLFPLILCHVKRLSPDGSLPLFPSSLPTRFPIFSFVAMSSKLCWGSIFLRDDCLVGGGCNIPAVEMFIPSVSLKDEKTNEGAAK